MSYTIEYGRQFIQSQLGITPCWLAGSNNLWTGSGRHQKIVRKWSVFCNLVGVTEDEIVANIKGSLGGFNEHWKKGGHFIDDAALLRWIRSGCRAAETVEGILQVNGIASLSCNLSVWKDGNHSNEMSVSVQTTAEFDQWISLVKARMTDLRAQGYTPYPIVDFHNETLVRVRHDKPCEKVIFKSKNRYLSIWTGHGSTWSSDIEDGRVFSWEEAQSLKQNCAGDSWILAAQLVNAKSRERPARKISSMKG